MRNGLKYAVNMSDVLYLDLLVKKDVTSNYLDINTPYPIINYLIIRLWFCMFMLHNHN